MAKYRKWCEELEQDLMADFPGDQVGVLPHSGGALYVDFVHYPERLNSLVGPGGWECDIIRRDNIGENMILDVALTILGVTKVNTGSEVESERHPSQLNDAGVTQMYGSPTTNAFAQAFKRVCSQGFGMGLSQLYDKSLRDNGKPQSSSSSSAPAPSSSSGAGPSAELPCPKCGGAMFDNRKKKNNPKAPDFKCAEKKGACKDGDYATSLWWDPMVEDLQKKVDSAVLLDVINKAQGVVTMKLAEDDNAVEVFKAISYLRLELDKLKVSVTPVPLSEPEDDLPF